MKICFNSMIIVVKFDLFFFLTDLHLSALNVAQTMLLKDQQGNW